MPPSIERRLYKEYEIHAAVSDVWIAWTTEDGVRSFFSETCHIGESPGDPYEIYFNMDVAEGLRGSEGCKILRKEPHRRFAFTWNAPPHLEQVRNQYTVVEIRFSPLDNEKTKMTFVHEGWGEGEQWDQAYSYFERAWFELVIPKLEKFAKGEDPWS
ncbi:SRPBCC family protein [Pelagicoccus albus]|uniref:SRPBCC domain-containing protein n=1 Tax=Pelagicoccus albus TaxID=415222 RepID=A0A7X1B8U7_9BACT|nr:SRPBCC domain-containing protein [Pelagicoccus albus]MBC2607696.1 SRPBCC domain-containing protein [Pelagicoccus albus]